jgi:hypothetical protein
MRSAQCAGAELRLSGPRAAKQLPSFQEVIAVIVEWQFWAKSHFEDLPSGKVIRRVAS